MIHPNGVSRGEEFEPVTDHKSWEIVLKYLKGKSWFCHGISYAITLHVSIKFAVNSGSG